MVPAKGRAAQGRRDQLQPQLRRRARLCGYYGLAVSQGGQKPCWLPAVFAFNLGPLQVPFRELSSATQERNFSLAFKVAEAHGVPSLLDVDDMVSMERPDPLSVMTYCIQLYRRFGAQ